jgi:hypothetical protein
LFGRALWLVMAAPLVPFACSSGDASDHAAGSTAGSGGAASATNGAGASGGGDADAGDAGDPLFEAGCAPEYFVPEPPDSCGDYVRLPCGLPESMKPTAAAGCYLLQQDCEHLCPSLFFNCHAAEGSCSDAGAVVPDDAGVIAIDCAICAGGAGRVPAGLEPAQGVRAESALGVYFATASHLEAASVFAFRRMREELAVHGAPVSLRRAAGRAARDEVRHARIASRLARRFGAPSVPARVGRVPARSLEAMALENAVEGCVRETYAALVASHQAERAADAEIRHAMREVADDETRHAALSWAVARWASARLSPEARARIDAASRAAVEALREEAKRPVAHDLVEKAGVPDGAAQEALLGVLEARLWGRLA